MPFKSNLVVEEIPDRAHTWILRAPLEYKGHRDCFTVPQDYVTDFASVPKLFRWLVPKYGRYNKATALHDWFCSSEVSEGRITRRDADGIFRRTMRELRVGFLQRWIMWAAVRLWSLVERPQRVREMGPGEVVKLIVFGIIGLAVFAASLVVAALLYLFWALDVAVAGVRVGIWGVGRLFGRGEPGQAPEQFPTPPALWVL